MSSSASGPDVAAQVATAEASAEWKRAELVLYPVAPQITGRATEQEGTAVSALYHWREDFAFQVTPLWNWSSRPSSQLLLAWGVVGGVELRPLHRALDGLGGFQFSVVVNTGVGIGSGRVQLRAADGTGPAMEVDAGNRFLGSVGAGLRVLLGDRWALRLEVRDLFYTTQVDTVNGCNAQDLEALNNNFRTGFASGVPISSVAVGGSCGSATFSGIDPKTGLSLSRDIPLALNRLQTNSSAVTNDVGLYAGVAFLF